MNVRMHMQMFHLINMEAKALKNLKPLRFLHFLLNETP